MGLEEIYTEQDIWDRYCKMWYWFSVKSYANF